MNGSQLTGFFGKLPAHGDFVHRNLPNNFMRVWDQWLQRFIGGSQEQLGESWLDIYLTSPIWRFAFSCGVVDEYMWSGVLLPSVDRVGRYFPFSIITKIQPQTTVIEFMSLQSHWYEAVEDICLRALDERTTVDELLEEINDINLNKKTIYNQQAKINPNFGVVVDMEKEQSPVSVYPYLLEAFISASLPSYSVWVTRGSERLNPCTFVSRGFPQINGVAAMMDGRWHHWGWQLPYKLKDG